MNAIATTRPKPLYSFWLTFLLFMIAMLMITLTLGCAANNANFQNAKTQYAVAAADPNVMANAPVQMQEAQKNLDLAAKQHKDADQSHYSYLAVKHVEIARANSERKGAESELITQKSNRTQSLLVARTEEADDAHKAANLANERKQYAEERAAASNKDATDARQQTLNAEDRALASSKDATDARQRTVNAEDRATASNKDATDARATASAMSSRNKQLSQELKDLQARETTRGLEITLEGSYFETKKSDLKAGAKHKLDSVARALRENPKQEAIVEGHTDNAGTDEFNLGLSQERADAVAHYLVSHGIQSSRVVARGYGEEYPSVSNATAAGRQQNRRVDIVLLTNGVKAQDAVRKE